MIDKHGSEDRLADAIQEGNKLHPPGIIISGWVSEEYPIRPGEMISIHARSTADGPPVNYRESHWISAEDHRRILAIAKDAMLPHAAAIGKIAELEFKIRELTIIIETAQTLLWKGSSGQAKDVLEKALGWKK